MPLPQKVTERLARVPSRTPGVAGQLLMLTSLLFFISVGAYLGLQYGYRPYLDSQIEKLDKDIENFAKQIPPEEQTKIINFYSQLANLENILTNHVFVSSFFNWFENNTQVNVYYQDFSFDVTKGEVSLGGVSKTIADLGEQLIILDKLPEVKKAVLSSVNSETSGLKQFKLKLFIDPQMVKQPTSTN